MPERVAGRSGPPPTLAACHKRSPSHNSCRQAAAPVPVLPNQDNYAAPAEVALAAASVHLSMLGSPQGPQTIGFVGRCVPPARTAQLAPTPDPGCRQRFTTGLVAAIDKYVWGASDAEQAPPRLAGLKAAPPAPAGASRRIAAAAGRARARGAGAARLRRPGGTAGRAPRPP